MKKNYLHLIMLFSLLFSLTVGAQSDQKNYINYQGVARDSENNLMEQESIMVGIALKFGNADAAILYEESHSVTTDANGVFNLKIGSGNSTSDSYANLPWGDATFMTVSLNGNEIGTTELAAVPFAIASGDKQWAVVDSGDIENKNGGTVNIKNDFRVKGGFNLSAGNKVNEISDDSSLAENSNGILPTQRAVKTYVDNRFFIGGGIEQTAAEVPYDNTTSGLAANNTQAAIDELAGGTVDLDADPTNEFQLLNFDSTTNELSLSDGNTVTIPSGGTDADADATNELQDLSLAGTTLQISDGTGVDLSPIIPIGGTDDQLADEVPYDNTASGLAATHTQAAIDELASDGLVDTDDQALLLAGDVLTIEDGAGSIDLGVYRDDADADPTNEIDVTTETGILLGDGATVSGLVGASDGDVAKWDATAGNWVAGTDETSGGGGTSPWSSDGDKVYLTDGDVGIGTTNPTAKLDVDGFIVSKELTGSGLRNVMVDADGKFVEGSAGGSSLWTESGTDIYFNSGNVGIGTTDPVGQQHIHSISASSETRYTTDLTGDGINDGLAIGMVNTLSGLNGQIYNYEAGGSLRFGTEGTSRLTIDKDGNIGVGTFGPMAKLDVDGNIRSSDLTGAGERNVVADANGNLIIGAGSGAGSSPWSENGSNIHFTSGGVGIGTDDPEERLHVAGDMLVQSNLGRLTIGYINNGNQWALATKNSGGNLLFRSKPSGTNSFKTRFQMWQDGEFHIGDISGVDAWVHVMKNSTLSKPHLKLEEADDDFARIELTNSNTRFWHLAGYVGSAIAQDRFNIYNSNAGNIFSVHGNGNIVVNGTVAHSSDRRLKKDIITMPYGLETVMQLSPKAYYWKKDEKNDQRSLGLIAQDVQPIIKEIVHGSTDKDDMLSISYTELVPVLIKAIQEQQAAIEDGTQKISNLEKRLLRLEASLSK